MIKLCYKEYDWKASNEACKTFFDKTGLDLKTVFGDYIVACMKMPEGTGQFEQAQIYKHIHNERTAAIALHCIIKAAETGVSIEEVSDAISRVSWVISERPDGLSEPWPFVMLNTALGINDYENANLPKKKEAVTGAE
jgi:hypothetical protein